MPRNALIRSTSLLAVGAALVAATTAAAGSSSMTLIGVVRDFKATHPDFGPDVGPTGHVVKLAASELNERGNPALAGDGREVAAEWRNASGSPIMPGSTTVGQAITDFQIVDGNVKTTQSFAAEVRFIGAAIQNKSYHLPVTTRFSIGDDTFAPFGPFERPVAGNVNDDQSATGGANPIATRAFVLPDLYAPGTPIVVDGRAWEKIDSRSSGTSDSMWRIHGDVSSDDRTGRVIVLRNGDALPNYDGLYAQRDAAEYLADYTRDGHISIAAHQVIYLFELSTGYDYQDLVVLVSLATDASFFEGADPTSACFTTADINGALGDASAAGISSASSFAQWFADVPGVNAPKPHAITLTCGPDGFWVFETDDFTPLDRKGFGNEGDAHNRYFTYEIEATFTFDACAGQMIQFQGADDAWIFINDELVMDLGGTDADVAQVVEVDRVGLNDGDAYTLKFFYAHRSSDSAPFRIRTNIPMSTRSKVITATGALFD